MWGILQVKNIVTNLEGEINYYEVQVVLCY